VKQIDGKPWVEIVDFSAYGSAATASEPKVAAPGDLKAKVAQN